MKVIVTIAAVMLSLSLFQPFHDGADAQALPDEICFPDVPGVEHCIEPLVAQYYLTDVGHTYGAEMWLGEAIFLWGYPLSDLHWERNGDGDCVLTQWFERAVFEFHTPGVRALGPLSLRRLGAELYGDTQYDPQLCTANDWAAEN